MVLEKIRLEDSMSILIICAILGSLVFIYPVFIIAYLCFSFLKKVNIRKDPYFIALLFAIFLLAGSQFINLKHILISVRSSAPVFSADFEYLAAIIKLFAFSILFSGSYEALRKTDI